jgi:prevent-host-death family protein
MTPATPNADKAPRKAFFPRLRYLSAVTGPAGQSHPTEAAPMQSFSPDYASEHLEDLIERARSGEEIVIAQAGIPVARLVPILGPDPQPDEAHAPDSEVDQAFHGD